MAAPYGQFGPLDELGRALDAFQELVAGVGPDRWDDPTPCPEWSVRDLVDHVVRGHRIVADTLRGEPLLPIERSTSRAGILGDDAAAAHRLAAVELSDAFARPGALDRLITVPVGTVPGVVALHLRLVECLAHSWDLARATGQEPRVPDELAERTLTFALGKLADVPPDRHPFGPPQPVATDAPILDRLVALLGRDPTRVG